MSFNVFCSLIKKLQLIFYLASSITSVRNLLSGYVKPKNDLSIQINYGVIYLE